MSEKLSSLRREWEGQSSQSAGEVCEDEIAEIISGWTGIPVKKLAEVKSAELHCGYIRANAGMGESTRDLVFSGYNLIAENGKVIAESKKFTTGITYTEIDLFRIAAERRADKNFAATNKERALEYAFSLKTKNPVSFDTGFSGAPRGAKSEPFISFKSMVD